MKGLVHDWSNRNGARDCGQVWSSLAAALSDELKPQGDRFPGAEQD